MKSKDGYKNSIEHFFKTEKFISPTYKPKAKAKALAKAKK